MVRAPSRRAVLSRCLEPSPIVGCFAAASVQLALWPPVVRARRVERSSFVASRRVASLLMEPSALSALQGHAALPVPASLTLPSSGHAYGMPLKSNVGQIHDQSRMWPEVRRCPYAMKCLPPLSWAVRPLAASAPFVVRAQIPHASAVSRPRPQLPSSVFQASACVSPRSEQQVALVHRHHVRPTRRSSGRPKGRRLTPR